MDYNCLNSRKDIRIKKAYRRRALELHPDRNYGDVEKATKLFADVQTAYEVLSDPQERAWYDSHREVILGDEVATASGAQYSSGSVRGTTATDILRAIVQLNGTSDFSDSPNGFFTVLRDIFDGLADEERAVCDKHGLAINDYPSFGHAQDRYETVVRSFYAAWGSFSTRKDFAWMDKYKLFESPERRVRRLMEKENKRLREDGAREYNDTVRSLVLFVRKRDPRYVPNSQTEEERQKVLRDAAAAQAARSRAANQAKLEKHVQPEWVKPERPVGGNPFEEEVEEEEVEEQLECVACGKTFKSEKQYEVHEESKKHRKAVQQLKRKMNKEAKAMGLPKSTQDDSTFRDTKDHQGPDTDEQSADDGDGSVSNSHHQETFIPNGNGSAVAAADGDAPQPTQSHDSHQGDALSATSTLASEESDDDYGPRAEVEKRLLSGDTVSRDATQYIQTSDDLDDSASLAEETASLSVAEGRERQTPKAEGKAKQRRAKKAARQQSAVQTDKQVTCSIRFPLHSSLC